MRALTICQPYAHLICLPDDDPRAKRVENRTWHSFHTGPLLIHAGKSKQWLSGDNFGIPLSEMTFGAIVGICHMAGCVRIEFHRRNYRTIQASALRRWPWLQHHEHAEGPYGFVLTECRKLPKPIPCRGAQGLFEAPYTLSEIEALLSAPAQEERA